MMAIGMIRWSRFDGDATLLSMLGSIADPVVPLPDDLRAALESLPTPALADAVVRLQLRPRHAPTGVAGPPGVRLVGRALPVRHAGSVDVFLEVLDAAVPGDVLVVDNAGSRAEACVGDLVAYEAMQAGVVGLVIWGLHRDAAEIGAMGLPVFSYGTLPFGPLAPRPAAHGRFEVAQFGDALVTRADVVAADDNGVVFLDGDASAEIAATAELIRDAEASQMDLLRSGTSLRQQFDFATYLQERARDPGRTFREHLRELGRAVEE